MALAVVEALVEVSVDSEEEALEAAVQDVNGDGLVDKCLLCK